MTNFPSYRYDDKLIDAVKLFLKMPFDRFGWFYGRNGSETYDGQFEIRTGRGVDRISTLGELTRWNGRSNTGLFDAPCDSVTGSTGELWAPGTQSTVQLFASDACSMLTLERSASTSEHLGLEGIRYEGTASTLDNSSCWVRKEEVRYGGIPRGLRDITRCRVKTPLYLSFPHLYLADAVTRNGVTGLRPTASRHQFYMTLEPNTGVPLAVEARAQVNVRVSAVRHMNMFANAPDMFWPTVWFAQSARLPEMLAARLRPLLVLRRLGSTSGIVLVVIGVLLIGLALLMFVRMRKREPSEADSTVLLPPSAESSDS